MVEIEYQANSQSAVIKKLVYQDGQTWDIKYQVNIEVGRPRNGRLSGTVYHELDKARIAIDILGPGPYRKKTIRRKCYDVIMNEFPDRLEFKL